MTTAAGSSYSQNTGADDVYDPDAPFFQGTPPMKPLRLRLEPTPSPPPAVSLPRVSPPPRSGRKSSNRRVKVTPTQGDVVLIHYLDGGKRPEIAAEAGRQPLADFKDDGGEGEYDDDDDDLEPDSSQSSSSVYTGSPHSKMSPNPQIVKQGSMDLKFFAAAALSEAALSVSEPPNIDNPQPKDEVFNLKTQPKSVSSPLILDRPYTQQQRKTVQPHHPSPLPSYTTVQPPQLQPLPTRDSNSVLAPPITPSIAQSHSMDLYSPRQPSQVLRHPDILSPALPTPASQGHEELPPIQMASPKSESNGHTPILSLPPIRAHLGAQLEQPNFNEKELTLRHGFPHSPPAAAVPRMGMPGGHSSPPISPHNIYQSMPSPAQSMHMHSPYGNYYKNGPSSRSIDHSSVSSHTETPNTDLGTVSTPATSTSITDRMSIDNMTNPPTATFVCTFQGCNAPAFQTQYLLNSHANVHSSARPHYCPVKGCPRAEGGKGFKRKNEMIRHGLVHDSPGYVCPFCPDREHKYPRPDNLQRHVRVHHIDKDKDDPQLRDVLSQRPDGPNRGRRRRGAP